MDRGGKWTEVASGNRWRVDIGGEWTEVASGQRWRVDGGGEWTEVVSGQCPCPRSMLTIITYY